MVLHTVFNLEGHFTNLNKPRLRLWTHVNGIRFAIPGNSMLD